MGKTWTTKILAGVAALSVAWPVTAGAARADSQTHDDPKGDVATVKLDQRGGGPGVDVVSLTNKVTTSGALSVTLKAVHLPKTDFGATWYFKVGDKLAPLFYYDDKDQGEQVTFLGGGEGAPEDYECDDFRVTRKANTMTGYLPSGCLFGGNQVKIAGYLFEPQGTNKARIDDGRQKGYTKSRGLKYGPPLALSGE